MSNREKGTSNGKKEAWKGPYQCAVSWSGGKLDTEKAIELTGRRWADADGDASNWEWGTAWVWLTKAERDTLKSDRFLQLELNGVKVEVETP